ncbi:MAG: amidohydrolase family protein [Microthrixaceae bacterium]
MTDSTDRSTPTRIVDAHVHLWDPARTDWYPYLGGGRELGMGDVTGMARRFDPQTYRSEAGDWPVDKLVNVAAATGRHSIAETIEFDRLADADADTDGQPAALIGGLPATESTAEAISLIDDQMAAARFRGVRPMNPKAPPAPDGEVLAALTERNLVCELMVHPPDLLEAAHRVAGHPDLTVVVEHTGWPRSADDGERALWLEGMKALADTGQNVCAKLSGLAMPLGAMTADAFRPWLEPVIEMFGVDRCLFASNFPVDGLHGSLDQLWSAYAEVTAGLGVADVQALYAGTAERVYRC